MDAGSVPGNPGRDALGSAEGPQLCQGFPGWPRVGRASAGGAGPASQPEGPSCPHASFPWGASLSQAGSCHSFSQHRVLPARSHPLLGSRVLDVEIMTTWTMRSALALPGAPSAFPRGSPCPGRALPRRPTPSPGPHPHPRLSTTLAQASSPAHPLVQPQTWPSPRGTPCNFLGPEGPTTPPPPRRGRRRPPSKCQASWL